MGRLWALAVATAAAIFLSCFFLWNAHSMYRVDAARISARIHRRLAFGFSIDIAAPVSRAPEKLGAGIVLLALAAVLWLVWQHRAHTVVRRLDDRRLRFGPVTGPGSWFVPVANLALPPVAHGELASGVDVATSGVRRRLPVVAIVVWWGLVLTGVGALLLGLALTPAHPVLLSARRADHDLSHAYAYLTLAGLAAMFCVLVITRRIAWDELRVVRSHGRSQVWMGWGRGTASPDAEEG